MRKEIWLENTEKIMQNAKEKIQMLLKGESAYEEIVVHLPEGIYRPEDFVFSEADCSDNVRITYQAEGEVLIHGGLSIPKERWERPDEAMMVRFQEEARENIWMVDLTTYGLDEKDWGAMQAIGAYETSRKYSNVPKGNNCELYCDEKRMTIARYPNEGYNKFWGIVDVGDVWAFPGQNYFVGWEERRDHRAGIYIIDMETNKHIKKWADPSTAWMYGYFYYDWADASTPITINTDECSVYPKYVAQMGAREGALYYFYNVPEELDVEGEWYLDRKNAKLYFYPPKDAEKIEFCYKNMPLIRCTNVKNLTFSGMKLKYTLSDAIHCQGDGIWFQNLEISHVGGEGIVCKGYHNLVENCDISYIGKGGVRLDGGCRETLTPGNNRVTNCYIHDFSELYKTERPGVKLSGVGNLCDHNEIAYAPHAAIMYEGNEQIMEYNYIHHVVLMSEDAGAIYGCLDWAAHGCVIRYNRLEQIGGNGFCPQGIYWDDGRSGQTAYGNVLVEIPNFGFQIGGGRENIVQNNVLVDCVIPIEYDTRCRDGVVNNGWFRKAVNSYEGRSWKSLAAVPYRTQANWIQKYPRLANAIMDFEQCDHPDFPANPSYSNVSGNIIIHAEKKLGQIAKDAYEYSIIENNYIYQNDEEAGFDRETLLFREDSPVFSDLPEFKNLPIEQMGRL